MEKIVVSAYGIVKPGQYSRMVYRCMVGKHVYEHAHAIFVCAVAHGLEIFAAAEHIVAYLPVGRLVVEIPFAAYAVAGLAHESHAAALAYIAGLHR